jgi:spermidine synthase
LLLVTQSGSTAALRTGEPIWQGRSAYGAYTVTENRERGLRFLFHGTTLHGVESLAATDRPSPMSYYAGEGPVGDVMAAFGERSRDVGVIGLGTGNMACYSQPGQAWTFYEIDGLVHRIAAHSGMFRSLRSCAPEAETILGDGRLNLAKAGRGIYDLFVVDAFASDAIPVHLMTREAFVVYREALRPEGVLVVHISNRHFDLAPIVARIAAEAGLVAYARHFVRPEDGEIARVTSSVWMVLARDEAHLRGLAADPQWKKREAASSTPLWTDDFANVLSALK